jgi:catechol 2,3-dioxygenase-like lactoylglutathione lyase family enzyme
MALTAATAPEAREQSRYDVGGVLLERPFKIRRLGHFGFNVRRNEEALHFYRDLLGFTVSDEIDWGARLTPEQKVGLGSTRGAFMRHGGDHHSFVLFPLVPMERLRGSSSGEITINQITWQVGSLKEVGDAVDFFGREGFQVGRVGRDTPGSNWHVYPADPDGHTNELYYGIEQIGWDGFSKPRAMYTRGFRERPPLPQISEFEEVQQAVASGIDLHSGYRAAEKPERTFDVDGILLAQPFKIVKIGPVRLFVRDIEESLAYYTRGLGLSVTDEVEFQGHRCVFLRANTEHHSLALYPLALRETLGLSPHTTCFSFGVQLANYRQLRGAVHFLRERGVTVRDLPPELSPGIDYSAFAIDPDGHAIQLYYYMQQVTPPSVASSASSGFESWPATVDPRPDTFAGEAYLGPWG